MKLEKRDEEEEDDSFLQEPNFENMSIGNDRNEL